VNRTALDILDGSTDVAILAGGEAFRTYMRARRSGERLPWPKAPDDDRPRRIGTALDMTHEAEAERGIRDAIHAYPMFESALRAAAGRSVEDHDAHLGRLWSALSEVAAGNPYAWIREAKTPEEITTVGPRNRMIGLPYPKYMNSNSDVDMAAAVIMCSVEAARRLGIADDRWVFPHAGAECHEHNFMSHRDRFDRTPAIEIGGRRTLELAGTGIDEIDVIDLYSCFPSAVQLGARSLGVDLDRQWSRTGGLSFAGGPWNNYPMHAIATVIDDLRRRPGERGLVWANGGFATKHAFGVYSTAPPTTTFRHAEPQDEIDALPRRRLVRGEEAAGAVTIEAYTVMHDRDGSPETGLAALRLADGRRAWGATRRADDVEAMTEGEWVGAAATLDADGVFALD
jgi:acetyl-CoA C-acetyltransferase